MTIATRFPKSWSIPEFDIKDPSLVLYLPLWYPYSDMAGSTIYSYDTNRHAGTVTGAVLGKYGRTFAGSDDVIDCGSASVLDDLGASSFGAWINPTATGVSNLGQIFHKRTEASDTGGLSFQVQGTNTLSFARTFEGGVVFQQSGNNGITVDVWQLVFCTWNGTSAFSGIKLYVNGVETSYQGDTNSSGALVTDAAYSMMIGATNGVARAFDGVIGDAWIYNRILSASEIMRIYQTTEWRYS